MAKRSVEGSPWLALAHDGPFYSDDDVAEIIETVDSASGKFSAKRQTELARRLERAAELLFKDRARQRAPTDKMSRESFEKIEMAAASLLSALGAGPSGGTGDMPAPILERLIKSAFLAEQSAEDIGAVPDPILVGLTEAASKRASRLGRSKIALVREALGSVVQLQRWARQQKEAALAAEETATDTRTRNFGDKAQDRWIKELIAIYRHFWKTRPGVSLIPDEGKHIGPFFRFVVTSGRSVGVEKRNQGLGRRIQRIISDMDKLTPK